MVHSNLGLIYVLRGANISMVLGVLRERAE